MLYWPAYEYSGDVVVDLSTRQLPTPHDKGKVQGEVESR